MTDLFRSVLINMADVESDRSTTDFDNMSTKTLRNFLRERNQKVTGVKSELVARAKGAYKLKLEKVTRSNIGPCEHVERLRTPSGIQLPNPSDLHTGWTCDLSVLPDFTEKDIYNYLVLSTHRTVDSRPMQAIRQLKAAVFYQDGHVHSVNANAISEHCDHMFVMCAVIPSLPTSNIRDNPDHKVWVCLSKVTGRVHSAFCTCAAGAGEACNHIAALLYGLADITNKKETGKLSCTSTTCKWQIPRKRKLDPLPSDQLHLMSNGRKSKRKREETETSDTNSTNKSDFQVKEPSSNTGMPKSTLDVERFRQKLCENQSKRKCGWVVNSDSSFDAHSVQKCLPHLAKPDFCYSDAMDLRSETCKTEFSMFFKNVKVSKEDAEIINDITRGQASQQVWTDARRERITSSNFGKVCLRRPSTEPDKLVHNILGYSNSFTSVHTRWGITHEPAARRLYWLEKSKTHPKIQVTQCGLLVNPDFPYLGASPDGLVLCFDCEHCDSTEGLVEIKCPSVFRNMTPAEAASNSDFFCDLDEENNIRLKEKHHYYFQVQGQMAVAQRQWCDFVVWTLKGIAIQRILFDQQKWEDMLKKLTSFYVSAIIPELFTRRVLRGLQLFKH